MMRSCEQAVAAGLPGLAFTDHLDFTTWVDGDQIGAENLDPHRYARMRLIDLDGYYETLRECRQRYPGAADPVRCRDRRGAPVGRERGRDGGPGRPRGSGPDPRLAARDPARRPADRRRRPVPADARRGGDAPLPRRAAAAGRGQRPVPGAGAHRLPAADVAVVGRPVSRAGVRGRVPGRAAGPGRRRPGARGEHQEPDALGRAGGLVAGGRRTGGLVRQRRAPALAGG